MRTEPVLTIVTGFVGATLALLAAFGLDFTTEQVAAITGFVVAVYGAAVWIRSKVSPAVKPQDTTVRGILRNDRGYGLVEVVFALVLIIVALILLTRFL